MEHAIEELKENISNIYNKTHKCIHPNIKRGHLRSISTDIEDEVGLFIAKLRPNCKIFIDSSIKINGKTHRPDVLILNEYNTVIAMIELKANMGWCRNAENIIDDIILNDEIFKGEKKLNCTFSNNNKEFIIYTNSVKLFLVSFTKANCNDKNHINNNNYANRKNVIFYNLFDGWYNSLINYEIEEFSSQIKNL